MFSKTKFVGVVLMAATLALTGCQAKEDSGDRTGFQLPQSPLLSALERKSGLIAYSGTDGNIYIVDQGGKNPTQITTDAKLQQGDFHYYEFPTWSPDSAQIAYYGIEGTSSTDAQSAIYTVSSDGNNLVEAYTSDSNIPIYLSWSPDSKNVSFIANIAGGNGLVLSLVPAEGGEPQVLDVGNPFYWDWLPDSSGVVVHTGGASYLNPAARLAFLSLADGVIEEGISLKPALFQSPALSPDGTRVLLAAETDDDKNALMVTDRAGEVQSVISTFDGSVAFGWSPDGERVAFMASDQTGSVTLGKLTVAELGGEGKTTTLEQDGVIAFYWAPDGKQLAYFVPMQVTATPEPGASDAGQDTQLYLKLYVADATKGKGTLVATFTPSQDFLRTIPYFDQYSRSATIWSPDSQNLVVSAYVSGGTQGIFVVPASGVTGPRFLQEGTMAFWSWK